MARIVNLTPHAINVVGADDKLFTIPPSGNVARVEEIRNIVDRYGLAMIEGEPVVGVMYMDDNMYTGQDHGEVAASVAIEISSVQYGEVTGLPDFQYGTLYIVSAMVKAALPKRLDLYSPGPLIRDEKGQPIGCRGLTR